MNAEEIKKYLKRRYKELEVDGERFRDELGQRYDQDLTEKVPLLYQYTNAAGLRGMIVDKELWASNMAYCNDSAEFHYGIEKYIEVIKASGTDGGTTETRIAAELVERLQRMDSSDTYICCLSRYGNQLGQWRGYGDRGYGYAVGFDFERVIKLYGVASHSWVLYSEEAQAEMFQKVGVGLIRDLLDGLDAADRGNAASDIVDIVMEDISTGLPFFKHPAFMEEGEHRLFSSVGDLWKYQHVKDFPVSVREGQNMLIPYVKLCDKEDGKHTHLPIKEIVVGPKADFDKAEQAIKILLKTHGYPNDITIRPSKIPFV